MYLGVVASRLGDEKAARKNFAEAVRLTEELVRKHPKDFSFKGDLSEIQGAWGDALLLLGKSEEAGKVYQQSFENLQLVIDHNPDDLSPRLALSLTHQRLGAISAADHKTADAEKHYEKALKLETALLQLEPANVTRQAARVLALARAGKHAEATAEAAKVQPRVARSPELLLQMARCYATCAADKSRKADCVKRALDALRAATAKEYRDAVALQTDPDLQSLRGEAAFQKILEEVKAR
jgi:tetratricopeptide (TPR) repeat protein